MANLQSVIELVFRGIDNASEVTNTVGKSLEGLTGKVSSVTGPLSNFAGSLAVVQTALAAFGGILGAVAYGQAVAFEKSLLALQKQMGEGEGSAQDLAAELEKLAVVYGTNANELVASAADFKAGGFDVKTSVDLVKQSLDVMIAGDISASEATDFLNKSLAGFQVPAANAAAEAKNFSEVINRIADMSASSFEELTVGFADMAPVAAVAGLNAAELASILSVVIDRTGSGAQSATSLNSALLSIIKPTKDAADSMKALGVNFTAADAPIGTVKDILATMAPAFSALSNEQQLQAAATIAGKEQASAFIAVLKDWETVQTRIKAALADTGSTIDKEVTIRLKSAEAVINSTNEAFRQLLTALGNEIKIETTGVVQSLGNLALAFKTVIESGALDPLFDQLRPRLNDLQELFNTVAQNLPKAFEGIQFDGLVKALENLGVNAKAALEALLGPIDLSTVEGLQAAIQKVVDLLAGLINVTAGELGGLAPLLTGIRELALGFKDAAPSSQLLLGNILGLSVGFETVLPAINSAALAFIAFGGAIKAAPALLTAFVAELRLIGALAAGGGIAAGLGAAGIAGAVGLLAFELTRMSGLGDVLNDALAPDALFGEGASLGTALYDLAEKLGLVGGAADEVKAPMQALPPYFEAEANAAKGTRTALNEWMDRQEAAAKVASDSSAELEALKKYYENLGYAYDTATGALKKLNEEGDNTKDPLGLDNVKIELINSAAGAVGNYASAAGGVSTAYSQIGGGTVVATGAFKAVGESASESAKKVDEATKKSDEFRIKMEEIASNERIKNIEAAVSIKTAQLEADAERVKATFASIDTTINSTGDLLGTLFGELSGATSWDKLVIRDQIDKENQRREEALKLQKKLAEKEMERIDAQVAALNRGDAIMKIDGAGLQPELEAFMWKILSLIRVRANAEFSEYLLGVGS